MHLQHNISNTRYFLHFLNGAFFLLIFLFSRELSSIFIEIYYQTIIHTLLKIDQIRFRKIVRYSFHDEDIRLTFSYNPIRIARSRLLQQKCRSRSFLSHGLRKYLTGNRSIRQKADQGAEVPNIETMVSLRGYSIFLYIAASIAQHNISRIARIKL